MNLKFCLVASPVQEPYGCCKRRCCKDDDCDESDGDCYCRRKNSDKRSNADKIINDGANDN